MWISEATEYSKIHSQLKTINGNWGEGRGRLGIDIRNLWIILSLESEYNLDH